MKVAIYQDKSKIIIRFGKVVVTVNFKSIDCVSDVIVVEDDENGV